MNGCVVVLAFVFIPFLTTFFLLKNGLTVLHLAAEKGFEQIVKILVDHGSNVDLQKKVFILILISFVFSHFFICCCGFIVGLFHVVREWLLCCVIFILFLFFF